MMRPNPPTIAALLILTTANAIALTVSADAEEPPSQKSNERAIAAKPIDPVISGLPRAVVRTYQALFPGHRVWRSSETGKGDARQYELIIFQPNSPVVHSQRVGSAIVSSLLNYKLILSSTGKVIREQSHPISEDTVPKAVREAFDKWRRPFPRRFLLFEWRAYQEVGAERLYFVRVVLNAIEAYEATLKADGTFVKKSTHFNKDRSSRRDK